MIRLLFLIAIFFVHLNSNAQNEVQNASMNYNPKVFYINNLIFIIWPED